MIRPSLRLSRAGVLALLVFAAFGAASCAKKPVSLTDPSLVPPTYPEGRSANTHLVVYPDTPVPIQLWQDNGESGETTDDVLLSTSFVFESGAGAVVGMIADSTNASQYQVYKRQADGGFISLFPYTLKPTKTWPARQFDVYKFSDPHPYSTPTRQYIGRGVVDGLVTADAPLTNVSDLTQANVPGLLKYLGPVATTTPPGTADSLVLFTWQAVPGAAGYWVSMYGYPPAYLDVSGLFRNALPRPLIPERLPEYFVAYIPAPNTSYRLGTPLPSGSHLVSYDRELVMNNNYAVRIVAVDPEGQMLDYTGSTGAYIILGAANGEYYRYPLDAVLVRPVGFRPPPELTGGADESRLLHRRLAPGETRASAIAGPRH